MPGPSLGPSRCAERLATAIMDWVCSPNGRSESPVLSLPLQWQVSITFLFVPQPWLQPTNNHLYRCLGSWKERFYSLLKFLSTLFTFDAWNDDPLPAILLHQMEHLPRQQVPAPFPSSHLCSVKSQILYRWRVTERGSACYTKWERSWTTAIGLGIHLLALNNFLIFFQRPVDSSASCSEVLKCQCFPL